MIGKFYFLGKAEAWYLQTMRRLITWKRELKQKPSKEFEAVFFCATPCITQGTQISVSTIWVIFTAKGFLEVS